MSNYTEIKKIILKLNSDELLKEKIYIVGGTVPYLISNTMSNREHSDIDIIVDEKNMDIIRQYLKNNNLYNKELDSKTFNYNKDSIDYGIDCVINGITVNFAPFVILDKGIMQRNFLNRKSSGINALVTVTMENIELNDCIESFSIEQIHLKTYSLEMIRIMKEKSNKPKDEIDIKVIDEYGYDNKKYDDLKTKTNSMKFKISPKSRILRLFIR